MSNGDMIIFYEDTDECFKDSKYRLDRLDERIRSDINHLIYEERGINESVRYNCVKLFNMVLDDARNREREEIDGFKGVFKRYGSLKFKFGIAENEVIDIKIPEKPINIYYYFYNFVNKDVKLNFDKNHEGHEYSCKCVCNGKGYLNYITLNFYMISGKADTSKWADSIQHELSHDFEQTNIGSNYKINNYYNFCLWKMNSVNIGEKSVATILYLSDKNERRAYPNGLYAYMGNKNIIRPGYNSLRHCDFFKMLKLLNSSLAFVKTNKNDNGVVYMLDTVKISYNKLLKIGDNAIKEWNRDAMRTIDKYNKDFQNKYNYWTDGYITDFI